MVTYYQCIRLKTTAGTALDIPMLTDVHLTVNIAAKHLSKQIIGRLRDLKDKETRFYYYYATNIDKHVKYESTRMKIVKQSSKVFTKRTYGKMIG